MKSINLFIAVIFGLSLSFMSLQNTSSDLTPRKKKWAKIDQNIKQRKDPKTTLTLCEELQEEIERGNYPDEEVKIKLYIHHLNYELSDDTDQLNQNMISELDTDIQSMSFPQSNYMALIGYKLVENYITTHRWEIYQRVNVNYAASDIQTWRMDDLIKKSASYKALMFNKSDKLKDIPITDASYLILEEKNQVPYIKNVYQALLYLDLQFQKEQLYDAQISALDIEDAFSEYSSNKLLQTYINSSKVFRNEFPEDIKIRLEMEFWAHLVSLHNTPKIEEIYLNNLVAINTKDNPVLQAEKNYRIALLYYSKANKINWNGLKNIDDINRLKKDKTDQFNKTIQYLKNIPDILKDTKSGRANELKNNTALLNASIQTYTTLNFNGKHSHLSNQDIVFDITVKNIKTLNLEVYKLDPIEYYNKTQSLHWNNKQQILSHLTNKTKQWEGQYDITYTSDYIEDKRQLILPSQDYGLYAVTLKGNHNKSFIFQVSDLYIERDKKQLTVKSAKDYSTIKHATLCVGSEKSKCIPFDKTGSVSYHTNKREFYSVIHDKDIYYLMEQYLNYYPERNYDNTHYKDAIFTDRAIYRPGQTVHVKVLQKHKKKNDILYTLSHSNKVKIELRDTQYELIEEKTVSLNEFASGNTSFVLPKDLLNGSFTLVTSYGRTRIQVEEYKRPTFFIEFEKDSTEKRLGDIIRLPLKAQTFSGVALNEANVEYTITYSNLSYMFWRCGIFNWSESYILNHQKTTLDKEGNLILEINSNDIPEAMKEKDLVQFSVEAKVIDINGDSETESTSFILSHDGLKIGALQDQKITANSVLNTTIDITNFQDVDINKIINYTIWKLKEPKFIFQQTNAASENGWLLPNGYKTPKGLEYLPILNKDAPETWDTELKITSGQIESNQSAKIGPDFIPGVYRVTYNVKDTNGKTISKTQHIKVFPTKGKPQIKDEHVFSSAIQTTYTVGNEFMTHLVLPFTADYHYVLSDFNGILQSGVIKGNTVFKLTQIIEERSKGGLVLDIKTVYNNKLYKFSKHYNVDWKLDLATKWVNIRHKIQPQSKEEWQLEVQTASGNNEPVEVLAFMYDASLDEIKAHNISYHLERQPTFVRSNFLNEHHLRPNLINSIYSNHQGYYAYELKTLNGVQISPALNMLSLSSGHRYRSNRFVERSFNSKPGNAILAVQVDGVEMEESSGNVMYMADAAEDISLDQGAMLSKGTVVPASNQTNGPGKTENKSTQIRKNFEETIFFYPELTTNDKGIVHIPFSMSDGIGQYKLMLYGHTKDLKQFYLEEDIISNKELMTELHKPRFLYSGDKIVWTAKISNLSDQTQEATVQLRLTDALTSELIFESSNTPQSITLNPGESQSVQWESKIPNSMIGEVKYELRAETEKYVDVEIDHIPVLTSQKRIHENFALTIPANQSKTFNLSELLNTTNIEEFRLECMSKPIWQVIKALPYAKSKDDKIISNLLDEYVTIKIGQNILKKNPNISERLLALSKTTQHSELRNRQELKSISLEESPWLDNAKNQEEEMKQLANFFNKNNLENRVKSLERKISRHQNASGGFPWIKGGKDSYYMSLYVAKNLSNLEKLNLGTNDLTELKSKLLTYLDLEVLEQYKRLERRHALKDVNVSHVMYLETRSYFLNAFTISKEALVSYDFFLQRSLDHWTDAGFINRISLAKIAHKNGKMKIADDIFKTINEYRIDNTDQQTIYWKQLANGVSWQNRKFVNHADLIHLYALRGELDSDIYKLQNWLLQQKRSQYWGSSSETSQLIYALLLNVDDTRIFDQVPIDIKLGGKSVEFSQVEGWLSKTWTANELPTLHQLKLEITNRSDHPIWVSGYQQYFAPIAEVKSEKKSLCSIEKTFYKRVYKNNTESWIKTDLQHLNVGDDVKVNMKLTIPQQLDFVYLQDYFGACFEPVERISGFKYDYTGSYYLNIKDHKMQFFFDHIARGTHEFEFKTRIKQRGTFSNGYSEFQSYYAPEFGGHSDSKYVRVE